MKGIPVLSAHVACHRRRVMHPSPSTGPTVCTRSLLWYEHGAQPAPFPHNSSPFSAPTRHAVRYPPVTTPAKCAPRCQVVSRPRRAEAESSAFRSAIIRRRPRMAPPTPLSTGRTSGAIVGDPWLPNKVQRKRTTTARREGAATLRAARPRLRLSRGPAERRSRVPRRCCPKTAHVQHNTALQMRAARARAPQGRFPSRSCWWRPCSRALPRASPPAWRARAGTS